MACNKTNEMRLERSYFTGGTTGPGTRGTTSSSQLALARDAALATSSSSAWPGGSMGRRLGRRERRRRPLAASESSEGESEVEYSVCINHGQLQQTYGPVFNISVVLGRCVCGWACIRESFFACQRATLVCAVECDNSGRGGVWQRNKRPIYCFPREADVQINQ